jgi:cytochrome c-type biogenesis protein CcmH/NrfG
MNTSQHPDDRPDRLDDNSFSKRMERRLARLRENGPRDLWWQLLDLFETHRALRLAVYAAGVAILLGIVTSVWVYPWWRQRTAVGMARQWLEAGRLDHASESIRQALKVAPENPESWKLAGDLARRLGNQASAAGYSKKAAELAPDNTGLALAWAADALLADQAGETVLALATLPACTVSASSHAQRLLGELARRKLDLTAARTHFENALRIDGPGTVIDEVPLGTILLNARDPAERRRGLDLLVKWTTSVEWGANALRTLLADSLARDDRAGLLRWADALRGHPRCTLGDIPNCLRALSLSNETRFAEVLAVMEKHHAADPANIALLVSWLNQIGRSREAVTWVNTLPPAFTRKPPAAVGVAESLRQSADWDALLEWSGRADWGRDLEAVRLGYTLKAARESGRKETEKELWTTLQARAATDGERTLFTADTLYGWGLRDYALTLLWAAADEPGIAVQVLGTLARHYQVERNADGQYQAFKRLYSLRPQDAAIANNYVFFATLTGKDPRKTEEIAAANFKQAPDNLAYRSTYALVLCTRNRATEALALLKPFAADWKTTPEITLAYGLALAGTSQKTEARTVLSSVAKDSLTAQEIALIEKAMK